MSVKISRQSKCLYKLPVISENLPRKWDTFPKFGPFWGEQRLYNSVIFTRSTQHLNTCTQIKPIPSYLFSKLVVANLCNIQKNFFIICNHITQIRNPIQENRQWGCKHFIRRIGVENLKILPIHELRFGTQSTDIITITS